MEQQLLSIYLNDHLFTLTGTHALAQRMLSPNNGTQFETTIDDALRVLEQNLGTLRTTMDEVGVRPRPLRQKMARLLPRFGLVKMNGRLTTYSPLSRVHEFEALTAATIHDRMLWKGLDRLADSDRRIPRSGIAEVLRRTSALLEGLEKAHGEAVEVLAQT